MSTSREKDELTSAHGGWTAHNVRLAEGLYTLSEQPSGDEVKLRRVTQIVLDLFGGDLTGLRALDLACLEGMYSLELARRGAEVVAIEGREANLAKARFAAQATGIGGIDFQLGDVRDLSREQHGAFDVVLCLGILYHLAEADVFDFVRRIADVCRRALIVDTAISLAGREEAVDQGVAYRGETLVEHVPSAGEEERRRAVWSSLDNPTSFVLTTPSLLRLLSRAGFTSVYQCWVPAEPGKTTNRVTLVALKGETLADLVGPLPVEPVEDVPERPPLAAHLPQSRVWRLGRHFAPRPLRARVRRLLGAETRYHR
jgi:2-polyprenyl-3-methyl-5-hydroxy-6-metoxy-1,4-benzoquinol methylase